MERALITGVAGFIGSHLAAELLSLGWAVTGLDVRSPVSDPVAGENLAELIGDPRFQFVAGDVRGGDLAMVCEGVRAVFHLAGLPGVRRSWGDRFGDYLACNVLGTQRLLEACVATDVPRLVFASSSSVYGPGTGKPSKESDLPLPLSPYGVSKLAAERLCLAYANQRGAATSGRGTGNRGTCRRTRRPGGCSPLKTGPARPDGGCGYSSALTPCASSWTRPAPGTSWPGTPASTRRPASWSLMRTGNHAGW